jgi:tetratricopeptide (TPR) repeat protein
VNARTAGLILALLAILAPGCAREDPEAVWNQARLAFEARQFGRAEALMERVGKLREATPEDHTLRAQLLMARDKNEEALAELKAVPDSHRLAAQARLQAGQLELRRERARVAEDYFRDAIRLDPKLAAAHRELIFILGYELRRPELSEEFRALSECESLRFDQAFLWCLTRGSVWEPAEAAEKLAKFVAADPDDRQARLALAEMHRRMNRFDEAEGDVAPLGDDDPEARALRVLIALDRGDEAKAESLLGGGPRVHLKLALLRGRMAIARGEDKAAVAAFRDAIAAEPNNRDAVFGLAHALQRVGDPEAKHYLDLSARHERLGTLVQRAANLGSEKNVALIHDLGAACADVGRIAEARAWYSIAIKLNPFDSVAQQALYRLKSEGMPPAS